MNNIKRETTAKPFLRWTGSKNWFVKNELNKLIPNEFNNYHELFLGGGSVFFSIKKINEAFLYDINTELVNTYISIRDDLDLVIESLKKFNNSKEEYYSIRESKTNSTWEAAAKFIYLNRTSFNGIYRVNSKGIYNVPYGYRKNVDIVTEENLRLVHTALKDVNFYNQDFGSAMDKIKPKDFIFIDPPYTVAHEKNGFILYNQKLFSLEDQYRLSKMIEKINDIGAYFILTNAYHHKIMEIYAGLGSTIKVSRYNKVGGRNKTRGMVNELIITNCKLNRQ